MESQKAGEGATEKSARVGSEQGPPPSAPPQGRLGLPRTPGRVMGRGGGARAPSVHPNVSIPAGGFSLCLRFLFCKMEIIILMSPLCCYC